MADITPITNLRGPAARITGATVETVPADQAAEVAMTGPDQNRQFQFKVPRGLPGTNAVANDEAFATYIAAEDSETRAELNASFASSAQGAKADAAVPNTQAGRTALVGTTEFKGAFRRYDKGSRGVALGDSLTAAADNSVAHGVSWPTYAQLSTDWRVNIVFNAGVGGNKTADMRTRFPTDVTPYAPDWVTICGGRNDIGSVPLATTQENIAWLVAQTRAIGALPILMPTFPKNDPATLAQTLALNAWLKSYAASEGIPFIDVFSVLFDPATGGYRTGLGLPDGVHPTPAGHRTAGEYIGAALLGIVPWFTPSCPRDVADQGNKLPNRFWGMQTFGGDLAPSGWVAQNGSASATRQFLTDPDGTVWVEYTFDNSPSEFQFRLSAASRPNASGGQTWAASGLLRSDLSAGHVTVQLSARLTTPTSSYAVYQLPRQVRGRFYAEFFANGDINYQVTVPQGSTGYVRLAEPTLSRIA